MCGVTSSQPPRNGKHSRTDAPVAPTAEPARGGTSVPSIPLSAEHRPGAGDMSVGGLVREASTQMSALFRSEIELAKAEVSSEVRKGVKGSIFVIAALVILFFSVFFLFFAAQQALDIALSDWAAFLVTFGFMALIAGMLALIGYLRVRTIRKPERTIRTARESARALSRRAR